MLYSTWQIPFILQLVKLQASFLGLISCVISNAICDPNESYTCKQKGHDYENVKIKGINAETLVEQSAFIHNRWIRMSVEYKWYFTHVHSALMNKVESVLIGDIQSENDQVEVAMEGPDSKSLEVVGNLRGFVSRCEPRLLPLFELTPIECWYREMVFRQVELKREQYIERQSENEGQV